MKDQKKIKPFFQHLQDEKEKLPAYYHYTHTVAKSTQVRRITYIQGTTEVLECNAFHRPLSRPIQITDESD
jgi:hypothetical protein